METIKQLLSPSTFTKLGEIPKLLGDLIVRSPDIDCLFLNAGVQNPYDVAKPQHIDFAKYNEITVNYTSLVAILFAFLPFMKAKQGPASIIFTGTYFAITSAAVLLAYSASKSALNVFTLCLREQLKAEGSDGELGCFHEEAYAY